MTERNYSIERDLMEARVMAEGLEDYLRQDELYGSVDGWYSTDPEMPSLTIGGLLLRLSRLQRLESQMSSAQKATLTEIEALHDSVRERLTGRYHEKAVNEAGSRLRALEAFFADCEDDPEACADAYLPEAQRRTIVEEIVNALKKYNLPVIDLAATLRQRDTALRRYTKPAPFVWSTDLQAVYPQEKYWWLYVRPRERAVEGET